MKNLDEFKQNVIDLFITDLMIAAKTSDFYYTEKKLPKFIEKELISLGFKVCHKTHGGGIKISGWEDL